MHCYCLAYLNEHGNIDGSKAALLEVDPSLQKDPCAEWLPIYQDGFYLTMIVGALIGIVNTVVVAIFELIAPLEKCLTWPGEDAGTFKRIVLVQFLNLGAVFLLTEFTLGYAEDEFPLPILRGRYRDFDTDWFQAVAAKVTLAMISNSVAPHAGKAAEPFVQKLIIRWFLDRCCKKHLRKISNIEEDDAAEEAPKEGGERSSQTAREDNS